MSEDTQDESGNPAYSEDDADTRVSFDAKYAALIGSTEQGVYFEAVGPRHHTGSGWVVAVNPILTRKGDLEPVYVVRVYSLDGEVLAEDQHRYIYLGEPEIARVVEPKAEDDARDTQDTKDTQASSME